MFYAGQKYGPFIINMLTILALLRKETILVAKNIIIYGISMQKKQIIILIFLFFLGNKIMYHIYLIVYKNVIFSP